MNELRSALTRARRCASQAFRAIKAALRLTDYSRWQSNVTQPPGWDARNVIIASHIPPGSSVLDLGAGAQTLRGHLKIGCLYVPCDLVKSSSDAIVCDFNRGLYPQLDRHFDFAVCSGLLEYIREPVVFLKRTKGYAKKTLISYHPWTGGRTEKVTRLGHGWINHFSTEQLEQLFREGGYDYERVDEWQGHLIYCLRSS